MASEYEVVIDGDEVGLVVVLDHPEPTEAERATLDELAKFLGTDEGRRSLHEVWGPGHPITEAEAKMGTSALVQRILDRREQPRRRR